jgi:acetyl esterase/lipase
VTAGRIPPFRYGPHPAQVADLHVPAGSGPFPVVVLVHGGFWRVPWDRMLMRPLARDLVRRGYAAWNIEYRRVGEPGGGWPGTFADVAAAVDALDEAARGHALDLTRVVSVGHSAGGHLALWLAARAGLPAGGPGAGPRISPRAAVSQAGIADLRAAAEDGLGDGAAAELLGCHYPQCPDRYGLASPLSRLPLRVPQLLVHGDADDRVPVEQSRRYAEAARAAGDEVELVEFAGVGHFEPIDVTHRSWTAVRDRLPALLALEHRG